MRVLVLGGTGATGEVAARTATTLPGVDEIVIEDRELIDREALLAALRPVDVVLNIVGPQGDYGCRVLRAAIAAGTHYLDICDDPRATCAMLELDAEARAAGVCAIVGMGANPGIGTLLT
ncbi:saccharopine dehydrogenase NADP-binding domain-containing protein [Nocardia crassostreae]|uniref:saccharopine dehydrogenase NADP-binding domain-containing protein n=1 Tax=Nocardia crassostreae TaxID=53428 RepID=UPI000A413E95|nr:saccharopine dehydrogenase NADP-binding domain-containing protein [Nocardia crassostreae]